MILLNLLNALLGIIDNWYIRHHLSAIDSSEILDFRELKINDFTHGELAGRAICPSVATEGKICSKLHEVDDNSSIISVPLDVKDRTALVPLFSPAYVLPHKSPILISAAE